MQVTAGQGPQIPSGITFEALGNPLSETTPIDQWSSNV